MAANTAAEEVSSEDSNMEEKTACLSRTLEEKTNDHMIEQAVLMKVIKERKAYLRLLQARRSSSKRFGEGASVVGGVSTAQSHVLDSQFFAAKTKLEHVFTR